MNRHPVHHLLYWIAVAVLMTLVGLVMHHLIVWTPARFDAPGIHGPVIAAQRPKGGFHHGS